MSLTVFSTNFLKLGSQSNLLLYEGLWKANKGCIFHLQKATIKSKAFKEPVQKPAPFPYKEKNYTVWRRFIDTTTDRFDENTKLIVVDGPIAVGKTKFAKQLASELDMYHIPDANMDIRYITSNGFNLRCLDDKVPPSLQSFDEKKFCCDPTHFNVASFQIWMYRLRFSLYVDALAHILSTGQGVVIERSPWSDKAFLEAMSKSKYISKNARKAYYEIKRHTIPHLMRPHLIIYLDIPLAKVKENIKNRNLPYEQNSKALTDKFLQDMEDVYKTDVLAKLNTHAELLMYDWTEEGDIEAIVEDIERLDFGSYTKYDEKTIDWCIGKEQYWGDLRARYADHKDSLMALFNVPIFDCPELVVSGEDVEAYNNVVYKIPEMEYDEGYNPKQGDSGLIFKTSSPKYVKY